MKEKDIAAALVEQYRKTGKINYRDLADVLEAALIYHEAFEALKYVRPKPDKLLKVAATGESEVSVPAGIVELAYEAAMIVAGAHRRLGKPPKSKSESARERATVESAIMSAGPRYRVKSVIGALADRGMRRTTAFKYMKDAKKNLSENSGLKKTRR